jgi:purine-nucleoside phosphorylase
MQQYFDYFQNYEKLVDQAANYIQKIIKKNNCEQPVFAITLGSGLGDLSEKISGAIEIPYSKIPNFPTTTIPGHEGTLIIGKLSGVPVIGLKGRKHFYEAAHEPFNNGILKSVFAVHTMANLGIKNYFVTNAAGGLNTSYKVGDIMIIKSHINFLPNVLLGPKRDFDRIDSAVSNTEENKVWQFQPMNEAYNLELNKLLLKAGEKYKENLHQGTYLALTGPTYETEAECLAFRDGLGADAVGMSTASETVVARNRDMNVVGFSCITNVISKNGINATNHEEVKAILDSKKIKDRLSKTVLNFFKEFDKRV